MPTPRVTAPPNDPAMLGIDAPDHLPPNAGPSSQAIAALDGAIATAFPNFGPLIKDGENTYSKSKYIKPETLINDTRPALLAQGILISSCLELVRGGFVVTTTLTHSGGGWRSSSFPVANPGDASKVSASATKGQRINLLMLLAIVGRDDDGSEDPGPQQPAAHQYAQPPAAPAHPAAWPAPGYPVQTPPAMYPQPGQPTGDPPVEQQPPPLDASHSNVLPQAAWQQPAGGYPPPGPQPPAQQPYV